MSRYPIECLNGSWVVWSLPVQCTTGRDHTKLDKFETYAEGMSECSRRMLAQCEADGTADRPMLRQPSMPLPAGWRMETRREYYGRDPQGGAPLSRPVEVEVAATPPMSLLQRVWAFLRGLVSRLTDR